jgi:hypothetical protein
VNGPGFEAVFVGTGGAFRIVFGLAFFVHGLSFGRFEEMM